MPSWWRFPPFWSTFLTNLNLDLGYIPCRCVSLWQARCGCTRLFELVDFFSEKVTVENVCVRQVQIFPPVCCVSWFARCCNGSFWFILCRTALFVLFFFNLWQSFLQTNSNNTTFIQKLLRWNLKIANSTNALGHNSGHLSLGLFRGFLVQNIFKLWATLTPNTTSETLRWVSSRRSWWVHCWRPAVLT